MNSLPNKFYSSYYSGDYKKALKLIKLLVDENPQSHWYQAHYSSVLYQLNRYEEALMIAQAAMEIDRKCPLVLWHYASALKAVSRASEAISIYKKIIQQIKKIIATDQCLYGRDWYDSLSNDSRLKLSELLRDQKAYKEAVKYLEEHLLHRRRGLFSCSTKRNAEDILKDIKQKYWGNQQLNRLQKLDEKYSIKRINKINDASSVDRKSILLEKFKRAYADEDYEEALCFICELVYLDENSHWCWSRLSSVYYELRCYDQALFCAETALVFNKKCPLILWDYAAILRMKQQPLEAIEVYKNILKRGESAMACGECGEGFEKAKSLLNDVRLKLGRLFFEIGDNNKAKRYISMHLKNRAQGITSSTPKREVKLLLQNINQKIAS